MHFFNFDDNSYQKDDFEYTQTECADCQQLWLDGYNEGYFGWHPNAIVLESLYDIVDTPIQEDQKYSVDDSVGLHSFKKICSMMSYVLRSHPPRDTSQFSHPALDDQLFLRAVAYGQFLVNLGINNKDQFIPTRINGSILYLDFKQVLRLGLYIIDNMALVIGGPRVELFLLHLPITIEDERALDYYSHIYAKDLDFQNSRDEYIDLFPVESAFNTGIQEAINLTLPLNLLDETCTFDTCFVHEEEVVTKKEEDLVEYGDTCNLEGMTVQTPKEAFLALYQALAASDQIVADNEDEKFDIISRLIPSVDFCSEAYQRSECFVLQTVDLNDPNTWHSAPAAVLINAVKDLTIDEQAEFMYKRYRHIWRHVEGKVSPHVLNLKGMVYPHDDPDHIRHDYFLYMQWMIGLGFISFDEWNRYARSINLQFDYSFLRDVSKISNTCHDHKFSFQTWVYYPGEFPSDDKDFFELNRIGDWHHLRISKISGHCLGQFLTITSDMSCIEDLTSVDESLLTSWSISGYSFLSPEYLRSVKMDHSNPFSCTSFEDFLSRIAFIQQVFLKPDLHPMIHVLGHWHLNGSWVYRIGLLLVLTKFYLVHGGDWFIDSSGWEVFSLN